MNTIKPTLRSRWIATLLLPMLALLCAMQVEAAPLTLRLHRATLRNVDDAAGRWQFEGGTVTRDGAAFGHYTITRRVTWGGTDALNTAQTTVTIFQRGVTAPENITMQGAHDFSSGVYIGSVSAASRRFLARRGRTFAGNSATGLLVIQ